MTVFYALLSWRSFTERQNYINQLRPFITSQRVYEQLLATPPPEVKIDAPFNALCQEVLGTRQAFLAAQGPLASLVGDPLIFYVDREPQHPDLGGLIGPWISPETICVPFPQETERDWQWLVPLWSERGLIGILILGSKQDDSLYTQEEIEIARTVGERLIDTKASTEIARRLMALQRQRLAESQVTDRQTRRVLHDEVLPHLHAALLSLSNAHAEHGETMEALSSAHRQISNLLRDLPIVTAPEVTRRGLLSALRKTVENEFSGAFDQVTWQTPEDAEHQLGQFLPLVSEVVYFAAREAIRNAARHGRKEDVLPSLSIVTNQGPRGWELIVADDCGVNNPVAPDKKISSGQGLALHSTLMAVIGGELSFEQVPGEGTRVVIHFPPEEMQ
jgi:two-component sensor histidine kinase